MLVVVLAIGIYSYRRYWNVAIVNGVAISRIDYIKTMEKLGGKQTLDTMIDDALVLNEAKVKGVKIEQKSIDDEIATIEDQLKSRNQTLESALAASGMVKADLEKQIRIKQIETALSAPKTEISQAQIDEFLTTNKDNLPTGKTKDELNTLAKEQLMLEASQSASGEWMTNLRQSAKIEYR